MQACKNTCDKKTNKVANELNKPGLGKKTKYNREKGNTPHERQFKMEKKSGGGGGRKSGLFRGG